MNSVADGFAGLFLFLANWLSSSDGEGELHLESMLLTDTVLTVECELKFRWTEDATSIIDAEIPMMITFYTEVDDSSEMRFTRILRSPLEETYYTVIDSLEGEHLRSDEYSNIYLAIKAFQSIELEFPNSTEELEVLGVLLPSPVSQMENTVSLAPICGGDRFYRKVIVSRGE